MNVANLTFNKATMSLPDTEPLISCYPVSSLITVTNEPFFADFFSG